MKPVDPRIDTVLVPAGSRAFIIAENQKEYISLPSVRTPYAQVITRWELTEEERKKLVEGEDLFITVIAVGALQPLLPTVGPTDWTLCPICQVDIQRGIPHVAWCPW